MAARGNGFCISSLFHAALKGEGALARSGNFKSLTKVLPIACSSRCSMHLQSTPQENLVRSYCPFRRYQTTASRKQFLEISRRQGSILNRYATLASTEKEVLKRNLLYANVLIKVEGLDVAIVDSYCQFVNSTSGMLGLEVTKQFNLPTKPFTYKIANPPDSYKKHKTIYNLKSYGRMIQVKQLPVEQADIFLEHIQTNSPEGVKIHIELKTWQDFVSPPDPRLIEQRRQELERKKAIDMERKRQKTGG